MDHFYINFYRNFYFKTNGFIPSKPLNQSMYPGDFFQIINGEMIVLGNIFRNQIIDRQDSHIDYAITQNPALWNFSDGILKSYTSKGIEDNTSEHFNSNRQSIQFKAPGSFFFKSQDVESLKISDWITIKNEVIIKMTQVVYAFRALYIVTESAVASNWTLAISASENGALDLTSESDDYEFNDLFGHDETQTIIAKDMDYYYRETKKKPVFFKAKKLVVKQEKQDAFLSDLMANTNTRSEWVNSFFDYHFETEIEQPNYHDITRASCSLDMLQPNALNPNTALLFFDFTDMNLDDIEKLF